MDVVLPVLAVLLAIVIVWYGAAIRLNMPWAEEQRAREGITPTLSALIGDTMAQERPVLPAPHQEGDKPA